MDAGHTVTSDNDSLDRGQRRLVLTARLRCLHVFLHSAGAPPTTAKTDIQEGAQRCTREFRIFFLFIDAQPILETTILIQSQDPYYAQCFRGKTVSETGMRYLISSE